MSLVAYVCDTRHVKETACENCIVTTCVKYTNPPLRGADFQPDRDPNSLSMDRLACHNNCSSHGSSCTARRRRDRCRRQFVDHIWRQSLNADLHDLVLGTRARSVGHSRMRARSVRALPWCSASAACTKPWHCLSQSMLRGRRADDDCDVAVRHAGSGRSARGTSVAPGSIESSCSRCRRSRSHRRPNRPP
jgi:hypothetical protein